MILAASMGPMPKISVRVVPEASTSASMRLSRSAIFRSSVRTSRSTSEAKRRRRRAEAPPLGRMPRKMRAARSGEGIEAVVLAGVAGRKHPHPCRKLGQHIHHGLAGGCQPPRQVPTEAAGVLHRPPPLGEPFGPAFEGPQAGAALREASTLEELAFGFVDCRYGERPFVGIYPDEHIHERMHLRFGGTFAIGSREGHSDFGSSAPIPLLSHSAPGTGGTQA